MKLLYVHVHLHTYTPGEALVPLRSTSPGSVDFTVKVAFDTASGFMFSLNCSDLC